MANPVQLPAAHAVDLNAQSAIDLRAAQGFIPWAGPLLMLVARPLLMVLAQAFFALLFYLQHRPAPWRAAGLWWTIYGTLVDIGCLAGLLWLTRREGMRLRDLLGSVRLRRAHDLLLGLGYFVLVFPLFVIGGMLAHKLLYSPLEVDPGAYLVQPHPMPLWAIMYSLSVWWLIWSPTEEATYQAYTLPRLRALTGRTWIAFTTVGIVWAFQHALLPLIPDLRFIVFRTVAFLPGVLALMALYWRTRRLTPLIVAHWPMDIAAVVMTTTF